jgi:hypothetical protein
MRRLIWVLMLCASFAFAADVSGTWQVTVETSQGTGTPTLDLQQKGDQLTGTFHSQILGDAKVTGTVKGNAIEFSFEGDAGGQTLKVNYKGTIEGPAAMKGTAVYAGFDENAKWSAVKK